MSAFQPSGDEEAQALEQLLGYLNFSSGAADAQVLAGLNRLYVLAEDEAGGAPLWRVVSRRLRDKLGTLQRQSPTFEDAAQAAAVLDLLSDHVLPGYLQWHRDLLFHQTEETLFGPFFLGRTWEAVLQQGPPWSEAERITRAAISQLNDFLGHRPLPVLETRKTEPYAHERVRPVPLYIRGAGTAHGPYREVVKTAMTLLEEADEDLLRSAYFDPDALDELAFDPRAYDFDHPVNKRPNYHFGQWDPHHLDGSGRYRRFVVQQVTLDALASRCDLPLGFPRDELVFEAAAVLAGTVLMASGVSGASPDTHDSSATLAVLLPQIARYRDAYYQRLLRRVRGEHGKRLREEAVERKQAFGSARQHLNAELARLRASQLEHVHLAKVFARMGYPEPAAKQAAVVPVASARMLCQIDCLLTQGHRAIESGELRQAASLPAEIMDLLHRAIECGAAVDPWSILGFDAHFSIFPAPENSMHDYRADDLVQLMEQIFAYYSRVWSEAAAVDDELVCRQVRQEFQETADWWRQFAAHEVASVQCTDALQTYRASQRAAEALHLWHQGGAAAGNVRFWAPHAEMFDTPEAYALVIASLLDRGDFVASMALLSRWLGQAERIGFEQGESSFFRLAERWLLQLRRAARNNRSQGGGEARAPIPSGVGWPFVRRFFDVLEANAEQYWQPPQFELGNGPAASAEAAPPAGRGEQEDEEQELFGAAYEGVVYRDSADDGVDGDLFATDLDTHDELARESRRIGDRLAFLSCLAHLWRLAAASSEFSDPAPTEDADEQSHGGRISDLRRWIRQAAANRRQLAALLDSVRDYRIASPAGDHDSMVEYDRKRLARESLLERIIANSVDLADAVRLLMAAVVSVSDSVEAALGDIPECAELPDEERAQLAVLAAMFRGEGREVRRLWSGLIQQLAKKPLLYVPIAKGGDPHGIVAARARQRGIQDLMIWLPRLGLLAETCELIDTARRMERDWPVGPGAVTEFDELFKIGYRSLVEALVAFAPSWRPAPARAGQKKNQKQVALVECLEQLTESLLVSWLTHSRTLRLSVLEKVNHASRWNKLVAFVKRYGEDLFTQHFLSLANLRAILHQGVDAWLKRLKALEHDELRLLRELDDKISLPDAAEQLALALEAIVENYGEYRDYNSTTTQSDRGDMLYLLLDFLRLRGQYDRICWNLKPIVLAHETLVRRGQEDAARLWRRALRQRISKEADLYLERLAKLQDKYAVRLPTITDRLGERFLRPMEVDRICALVEPAMEEARRPGARLAFEALERAAEAMTRRPTGAGLDTPAWLLAIEDEVERIRRPPHEKAVEAEFRELAPLAPCSLEEAREQIKQWAPQD